MVVVATVMKNSSIVFQEQARKHPSCNHKRQRRKYSNNSNFNKPFVIRRYFQH